MPIKHPVVVAYCSSYNFQHWMHYDILRKCQYKTDINQGISQEKRDPRTSNKLGKRNIPGDDHDLHKEFERLNDSLLLIDSYGIYPVK